MYGVPAAIKTAIDDGKGFAAVVLKDRTDFSRAVAEYISNSMYVEEGSVYFSNTYSLGGKIVYKFEINRWNNGGEDQLPEDVSAKLTEVINELNWGADQKEFEWETSDEENTYELTRGYK